MQKFEPDQRVLVRENDTQVWRLTHYSHTVEGMDWNVTIDGKIWASQFIIPYSGNEHLLGATDSPTPKWEPKPGELVAVSDTGKKGAWEIGIYKGKSKRKEMPYLMSRSLGGDVFSWKYCEPIRKHFNVPEE